MFAAAGIRSGNAWNGRSRSPAINPFFHAANSPSFGELPLRPRHERLVDLAVEGVRREVLVLREDSQILARNRLEFGVLDRPRVVLQVLVEPLEHGDAQVRPIVVAAAADVFVHESVLP